MRYQLSTAVFLILVIALFKGYYNIKVIFTDYVSSHRKSNMSPDDIRDERLLKIFNYGVVIAVILILAIIWSYARYYTYWGFLMVVLLLLIAGYVNIIKMFRDIS